MKHSVRAKKHLGQHFLNDEAVAFDIVNALLEKDREHAIIEIGPGTGVLTKYLIQEKTDFIALDVDRDSIAYLKEHFPLQEKRFVLKDFLECDLDELVQGSFNVIGNFPYNISTEILFKILEHKEKVPIVVGMFQKEVAERIAEKPGNKTYGITSVLLQAFYNIEYLFTVNENVFTPPPKVKSAVIRLTRNSVKALHCDEVLFKKLVKATFNQRRKTIRNSIKSLSEGKVFDHPLLEKRPEQLSVEQFVDLCRALEASLIK